MAIFEIQGPDGAIYEVDAPDEQSAIAGFQQAIGGAQPQAQQPESGGYGSQIFSGLLEGATGALGAPVDLANNFLVAPALRGINAVFGTDLQPSAEPLGGSVGLRRGLAIAPQSDSTGEQVARRIAQSVGGAAVPLSATSQTAGQLAAGLGTAIGGGVGGAAAQQLFPGNVGVEIAGELIGGLGTGAAIGGMADRAARRAAEKAVPSVEQLKARAGELYDLAEQQGVTATQQQTQGLARNFRNIATQEGLISPTGRVSEAYPRAAEALRVMDDYATGAMTPTQMQTVRDVLSDAVSATKGKERRIASMMLDQFDGFTAPLAPPLAEARKLYSQALRGDKLETLSELAGARAGQFTGSGYENALRTEYRNLDRRIVAGKEGGWSPEQIEAIQRVSRGTPASNAFRNVGRLAPTGVVGFGAMGPGLIGIGALLGAPGAGFAASALGAGAAFGARGIATKMGIRNAEIAELLARGGAMPSGGNEAIRRRIIEALVGSQASAQSPR